MCLLRPRGLEAPVIVPQDAAFLTALQRCMKGWTLHHQPVMPDHPLDLVPLTVIEPRGPGRYRAHSRYLDDPVDGLALAAAVCAVLADLSQAASEQRADHDLGLHCGGVLIGTRGIILAGARRAGKSTLVARLSAEPDVTVLADDVLPIGAGGDMIGLGLAPRLRLPLPETASLAFHEHVDRWLGPRDDRYGYLLIPALQPRGTRAPAEALVLLDRRPGVAASLHHLPADRVLRAIVERSIAGPEGAGRVYDAARSLALGLVGLRLVYSDLEQAVALLRAAFPAAGRCPAQAVALTPDLPDSPPAALAPPAPPGTPFHRAPGTTTRRMGEAAFLWRPDGDMLWHLNPVADIVWRLLARPASPATIAKRLKTIFPDQPLPGLQDDVCLLLGQMRDEGLVVPSARPRRPALAAALHTDGQTGTRECP